jgi:hypothetical protein
MSKNLNSELTKEENFTYDPSRCEVEGSPGAVGHEPYGERPVDYTTYVDHLLLK